MGKAYRPMSRFLPAKREPRKFRCGEAGLPWTKEFDANPTPAIKINSLYKCSIALKWVYMIATS
jgi:hypothetical protein